MCRDRTGNVGGVLLPEEPGSASVRIDLSRKVLDLLPREYSSAFQTDVLCVIAATSQLEQIVRRWKRLLCASERPVSCIVKLMYVSRRYLGRLFSNPTFGRKGDGSFITELLRNLEIKLSRL